MPTQEEIDALNQRPPWETTDNLREAGVTFTSEDAARHAAAQEADDLRALRTATVDFTEADRERHRKQDAVEKTLPAISEEDDAPIANQATTSTKVPANMPQGPFAHAEKSKSYPITSAASGGAQRLKGKMSSQWEKNIHRRKV